MSKLHISKNISCIIQVFIVLSFLFIKPIVAKPILDTTGYHQAILSLHPFQYSKPDSILPLLDSMMPHLKQFGNSATLEMAYKTYGNIYVGLQKHRMALFNYRKGISIARQLHDTFGVAAITHGVAAVFLNQGKNDSAAIYLNRAYRLAQMTHDTVLTPVIMIDLSNLRISLGDYDSAVNLLYSVEHFFLNTKNNFRLVLLYNQLGTTFQMARRFDEALLSYQKALRYDSLTNRLFFAPQILGNIGQLYSMEKKYDSALLFLLKAKEMLSPSYQPMFYYNVTTNIGNIYLKIKKYDKALKLYNEVVHSSIYQDNNTLKAAVTINLGTLFYYTGKYDSAKAYTSKGLHMAKENGMMEYEKNAYATLFSIDSAQGEWHQAIKNLQRANKLNDSLINVRTLEKIDSMRITNDLKNQLAINSLLNKKNNLKNKLLKKQAHLLYIQAGFILFFLILLLIITLSKRKIKSLHDELTNKNEEINHKNEELTQYTIELEKLNRAKNKFFSIVGHDLRSPFSSLINIIELLESPDYELSDEESKNLISAMGKSARNTFDLLQNLLEWSRLQQGQIINKPSLFHVYPIAMQTCELYVLNVSQKNINIECSIGEEIVAYADQRLFTNLLNNLVNNAVKFTDNGGSIKITSSIKDDFVEVSVSDSGIGIPKDKLKTLFDVDNEYLMIGTQKEKGTGLGLTLCKEYALLMGGTISVESNESKGSRFYFTLPAHA